MYVTLHVSVWVEIYPLLCVTEITLVTLHVSVWVEMQIRVLNRYCYLSRSTWACELKLSLEYNPIENYSVTLHVSVWVEIISDTILQGDDIVTLHVSVWVEIWTFVNWQFLHIVTLHVSVWVEICFNITALPFSSLSRSTWACELKSPDVPNKHEQVIVTLHVSVWVEIPFKACLHILAMSRSTWACELKCARFLVISTSCKSRSTWACELKYPMGEIGTVTLRHAPRERVSWNMQRKKERV